MNKIPRRLISFFALICFIISCCGCGEQATNGKGKPNKPDTSSAVEDTSLSEDTSSDAVSDVIVSKPMVDENAVKYYKPTSVTLSFYDTAASSYGFTWNTEFKPLEPIIQICEGKSFDETKCIEYTATVKAESVAMPAVTYIYICKAEVPLKQNKTYTYRAYDKGAKAASATATFKTGNSTANSFKFVHVSDSQVAGATDDYSGDGTGGYFANTLKGIMQNTPDFMLHTGDFVEYSKYEGYWKNMLDFNAQYLMKLPIMSLSGNHETTYRSGTNETFKHFNHKIPNQTSTKRGYYYSFNYGNAKFIMLNTNNTVTSGLETEQYNWLINELKNNNKKWTIVAMHNPMYSVGQYGANPSKNSISLALRSQLVRVFAEYKVDLVLQGHDHLYSKTYPIKADGTADTAPTYETLNSVKYTVNPTGTMYSMHGAAGNQNRSPYEVDNGIYEIAAKSNTNSWAEISVEGDHLTVHIKYYENGTVNTFDSYGIVKN